MDWFSAVGLTLIVLIVIGLIIYSIRSGQPSESKLHLPRISHSVE
jgi:hypothetical protein